MNKKFIHWLLFFIWMSLIFLISHQPKANLPDGGSWDYLFKKTAHFLAYAVLWVLANRAIERPYIALFFTSLYAMSDEYHQTFIPNRHGTVTDVLIDSAGALAALLGYPFFKQMGVNNAKR